MKFSQRIGKTGIREVIQIESIDKALKNRLWNVILRDFFNRLQDYTSYGVGESQKDTIFKLIWTEFFNERSDIVRQYNGSHYYDFSDRSFSYQAVFKYLNSWFFDAQWYEIYDLVEFLARFDNQSLHFGFIKSCNEALKREMAGYRIIDEKVVQVTSEEEIAAVEKAINSSSRWQSVNTHLSTALTYLSDRKRPDYRNSIKESISAVEAFCIILTGDSKATLGKALAKIEADYKMHGSLKSAFSALYGYTSDEGGIRHALLEDDTPITMEDAKFMLISCSAFINYLMVKVGK
ncbi:hypothetical protein SAMN05421747_13311 [Parapedobacter composti]|uniref:HEPN AbiJ-N-terminal domain-containing protein n=1 Tax=Parapedobacter composti TaxID=623281 RepID=A0A1I1MCX9_9SPHI|nr:hypothetical protein [Parapedobacter composti]SFC83229.1 hypothetical protein SAMN05421747_13311 [Parapedobacter composti]